MSRDRVIVARIGAAHGVRGDVRLKSFTEQPRDVAAYGPLTAADGRRFEIENLRPASGKSADVFVARLSGVADRDEAEKLNGVELSIAREALPATGEDEFYHADLVGLAAVSPEGEALGTVAAVVNYGAGDLLEIAPEDRTSFLVPFTREVAPEVDLDGGRIVVVPPAVAAYAGDADPGAEGDAP